MRLARLGWLAVGGCSALLGLEDPVRQVDGGGPAGIDAALVSDAAGVADARAGVADARPPDGRLGGADAVVVPDADPDPDPDAFTTCGWRYSPQNFNPCFLPASNGPLTIPAGVDDAVIDTDSAQITRQGTTATLVAELRQQQGAGPFLLVHLDTLGVGGTLRVVGSYPLVLAVDGAANVADGTIDVSARMLPNGASEAGPGGDDPVVCPFRSEMIGHNIGSLDEGAGGGGGGGYGSAGATGGRGGNHAASGGGAAGPESGDASLVPLRGGCRGGAGGNAGLPGGFGGAGGGALQISSDTLGITQDARLMANGAGGQAGFFSAAAPSPSGGGGGGAGGAILLEAYSMVAIGTNGTHPAICANGGGGGEGSYPAQGAHGALGTCSSTEAGLGGAAVAGAGDGGSGGYFGQPAGQNGFPGANGATPAGGGGAGGAVGRIRVLETFSPPPFLGNSDVSPTPVFE